MDKQIIIKIRILKVPNLSQKDLNFVFVMFFHLLIYSYRGVHNLFLSSLFTV